MLRYLRGTVGYGLRYTTDSDMQLVGYTYSYWASSVEDWKSTFGCFFSLGSIVISGFSRKQTSVALSSADEVYCNVYGSSGSCVAAEATCWFIWAYVGVYCYSLRQPELCTDVSESSSS